MRRKSASVKIAGRSFSGKFIARQMRKAPTQAKVGPLLIFEGSLRIKPHRSFNIFATGPFSLIFIGLDNLFYQWITNYIRCVKVGEI
jgi:hypothetical protein